MAGNVWQWCLNPHEDPANVALQAGASRVMRGGSWVDGPWSARTALRFRVNPGYRIDGFGLRVCRGSPIENKRAPRRWPVAH